ncbi:hypothetical protein BVI2075_200167 [Burkholderia vietnamiensis]|nr:hypothetical protein BVI2075_200167 [Burkholderia vietnamiensis]
MRTMARTQSGPVVTHAHFRAAARRFVMGAAGFCNGLYGGRAHASLRRFISSRSGASVSCDRGLQLARARALQSVTIRGIRPDIRSSRIRVTFTHGPP